jgi:hypothetical protein
MTAVPPSNLAAQLLEAKAQIERMNRDGNALLQRNAELEAAAKQAAQASKPSSHVAKPKPPTAPEFSGAHLKGYEVDAWLREMKKQFDHYGESVFPDGVAMVRHAALFFKGAALEWWDAKDKSGGVDSDWDTFVAALRERYRPMQAATVARERINALRQKGAVSAYCDLFQKELTPIINMDPADQIFHFVKGLSSTVVQNKIREKEPKTLHAAMDIAVRADVYQGKGAPGSYGFRGFGSSSSSQGVVPMDVNAIDGGDSGMGVSDQGIITAAQLKEALAEQQKFFLAALQKTGASFSTAKGTNKGDKIPGLKPGDIDELRRQGRCFRCKKEGHMKNECPDRPKSGK